MKDADHVGECGHWRMLGLFLTVTMAAAGCTGAGISKSRMAQLQRRVQKHGLIVGFEGLQPFSGHRADNLTKNVAKELGLVQSATSGNWSAHLPLVRAANSYDQPVYIVGYSLGGLEARRLAEACKKEGIPVDILFLLDPGAMGVFTGKIPDNVRKVVFYQSGTYDSSVRDKPVDDFLEDPQRTHIEFEDLNKLNHMTLPSHLVRLIKDQIKDQIKGDPSGAR